MSYAGSLGEPYAHNPVDVEFPEATIVGTAPPTASEYWRSEARSVQQGGASTSQHQADDNAGSVVSLALAAAVLVGVAYLIGVNL